MAVIYRLAVVFVMFFSGQAIAGSMLGEIIDGLCGNCGLGEALDDTQQEIKQAMLTYKNAEQLIAKGVGRLTGEGFVGGAGPLVCAAIRESRDHATYAGSQAIPDDIYDQLSFYF